MSFDKYSDQHTIRVGAAAVSGPASVGQLLLNSIGNFRVETNAGFFFTGLADSALTVTGKISISPSTDLDLIAGNDILIKAASGDIGIQSASLTAATLATFSSGGIVLNDGAVMQVENIAPTAGTVTAAHLKQIFIGSLVVSSASFSALSVNHPTVDSHYNIKTALNPIVRNSIGDYTITFEKAIPATAIALFSIIGAAGEAWTYTIVALGTTSAQIEVYKETAGTMALGDPTGLKLVVFGG